MGITIGTSDWKFKDCKFVKVFVMKLWGVPEPKKIK